MKFFKKIFSKIREALTQKNGGKTRRTVFSVFAAVIALCTVSALVLPGITATANVYPLTETDITGVKLKIMTAGNGNWQTVGASTESLVVGVNDRLQFQLNYNLAAETLTSSCDTISYQLPVVFSRVTVIEGNPVIDNGNEIGTYSITQDGLVTITFFPEMVEDNATVPIVGLFSFDCKVSDVIGDGTTQTITIGEWSIDLSTDGGGGGGGDTTHHEEGPTETAPPQNQDLKVTKTHETIDSANGVVDCTVIIEADKATDEAPQIYDWMATGFTYLQDFRVREVTLNTDGTIKTFGNDVDGTTVIDGVETLVVGKRDFYFQCDDPMAKDAVYAITYRGKVIDPFSGSYHTNNQVKVTTKIEGDKVESGYKDDIWLYNDNFVTKKGTFKDGYIEWTITVHRPANSVLDGWVLSDILEGYDYTGTASMKIGNGTPTTINFPYTFPQGSTGSTSETYTFTYTSPYEPKIGQTGVVNSVTYRPGDYEGDNPIVITETIGMDENNPLEKTVEGLTIDTSVKNALAIVDWNVDITPTISDILGTDGYDWLYDDTLHDGQYLTAAQAAELEATIVAEMTTKRGLERGTPPANENAAYDSAVQKQYTFELKRSEGSSLPSDCYDRFTLHVYVDLEKGDTINFDYSSTGLAGDLDEEHSYENRGKVMQNAPGNHVYTVESWVSAKYRPAILKTDPIPPTGTNKASSNELTTHEYYEVDGTLEWDLAVCVPDGIETPVTLTDTLPAGVTFDSVVLQVNKKTNPSYNVVWDDASTKTSGTIAVGTHGDAAVTRNGQTLTVVLDEDVAQYYAGTSDTLNFRVKAKLNQIPNYDGDDNAPRFSNTAAVKVPAGTSGEMQTLGEDTQAQRVTVDKYHGVLSKTVEQSAQDKTVGRIPYHIEINPDAKDLLDGTDTLILTDTLSAYCQNKDDVSVSLNPSTLHLYNRDETKQGNKGTPLDMSEYSYSYSSDYVDHHIKDYLTIHIPDERALVIEYTYVINTMGRFGSQVSNTVKLEGITDGEVTGGNTIDVDFTSSGAIAGLDGITLYKVDSKNYSLTLPDAQFTLYKYNGTAYAVDRVVTTNSNGVAQLTGLEEGYAYRLVETRAPENYIRDPDPYYFMMAGALETTAPSDFKGDLLQQGVAVYRPNISNYAEVNVVKQWQDANGSSVTHDGTVMFNLYRKVGTRDPHVTLTATITKQVKDGKPVTLPFTPQQFMRGDTVEFVVTETRYRPANKDSGVKSVTFYVNGDPRVIEPYWDPSQDYNDNATVTYTLTFRMDDDTNVVADLGELSNDPTIVARLSGTTLPPPTETSASSEPTQATYSVHFTDGGSGTVNGQPVSSGARFAAGTQMTLVPPGSTPGKQFTGWKILQRTNHNNDVTATCLSGNVLTTPAFGVDVVAQYNDIPVETYDVAVYNNLGTVSSDEAAEGSTVTVTANAPQPHYEFDHWVVVNSDGTPYVGADVVFADANSAETTFTMPNHAVVVEPKYKLKTAYTVTATADTGGTASYTITPAAETATDNKAYAGDTVTLSVPTVPAGKLFDKWVITSPATGFTFTVKDPNATFTMPASNVVVNATFRNKPDNLIMNGDFENVDGTITSSTGGFEIVEDVVISRDGGFEWTPVGGLDQIGSSWSVVDGVLVYDSTNATSNTNWVAKIDPTYNNGNGLKAKTTYTLFADVDTNRDAHFYVGVKEGNKLAAKIPNEDGYIQFTTGDDPSIYTIIVRMNKNESGGVQFSVDNVILVEGEVTEPPSGNPKYNVNVTQPASGGTISANKAKEEAGKTVTLTATPATGYALDHWVVTEHTSGDTISVASGGTFTMPEDDVDVTAVFSQGTYTVTVEGGTIYGSSATTAAIHVNDTVEIQLDTSQIPAGQEFYRWEIYAPNSGVFINTGMAQDTHATFKLNTADNVTLTATYQPIQYNITFTDGCGTASKNSTQVTKAGSGDTVQLIPNPPTGKVLDSWTVTNNTTLETVSVANDGTFTMPNSSVTVSATWKDAPTPPTPTVNNLIVNGYFDSGDTTGWSIGVPNSTYIDNFSVVNGKLVLMSKHGTRSTLLASYTEAIKPSTTYTLHVDVSDLGGDAKVVVQLDNNHSVNITSTGDYTFETYGSVDQFDIHIEVPQGQSGVAAGTFDNFILVEGSSIPGGGGGESSTPSSSTLESSTTTTTSTPTTEYKWENIVDRITLTFYDADCSEYGITYHSYTALTDPVIQYVAGANASASALAAGTTITPIDVPSNLEMSGKMVASYDPDTHTASDTSSKLDRHDNAFKGVLSGLSPNTTYTYRVGGKINGEEVWSEPYSFTTRAAATSTPDMSFIWFSDSQYGEGNGGENIGGTMKLMLDAANSLLPNPDMVLSGGDFTDCDQYMWEAAAQIGVNQDFFAKYPLFIASGNHDRYSASYNAANLVNVDETDSGGAASGTGEYYSFNYNGVHVVVLDNGEKNNDNISSTMVSWLENDLTANDANPDTEWTLVMMHKPIYACTKTAAGSNEASSKTTLGPIFANHQVDAVMQAHVHMYSRTTAIDATGAVTSGYTTANETKNGFTYEMVLNPGDPIYTVVGAAGPATLGNQRIPADTQPAYVVTADEMDANSFAIWRIENNKLYVDTCYADSSGNVHYIEHFGIDKSGTTPTPTTYTVTAATGLTGGTIASVSPVTAAAGDTITVTLSPNTGYELDAWNITGGITPTATGNENEYTFEMPAQNVTVSATFKETGGSGGGDDADNLLTNGDFSDGSTGWTGADSIAVSGGVASVTNGNQDNKTLRQLVSLTAGHNYTLTADILSTNNGLKLALVNDSTFVKTGIEAGSFTYNFTATGNETMINFGGTNRVFTIDNIVLIDNDAGGGGGGGGEETSVEYIVNGSFVDSSGWTTVAADINTHDHKATLNRYGSTAPSISQSFSVVAGKTYAVTVIYDNTDKYTDIPVKIGGTTVGTLTKSVSSTLTTTYTATETGTVTLQIGPSAPLDNVCNITKVSVMGPPAPDASPNVDDAPLLDSVAGNHAMLGDTSGGVFVGTYTITASNSWELLIENLISTEIVDGQEVFYVYYVEEVTPASDDFVRVAYDNNDGISSGDITIINTVSEEEREQIILPETGGGGNLPFVIGGTTLIAICLFGGVVMTRRRRRASG